MGAKMVSLGKFFSGKGRSCSSLYRKKTLTIKSGGDGGRERTSTVLTRESEIKTR